MGRQVNEDASQSLRQFLLAQHDPLGSPRDKKKQNVWHPFKYSLQLYREKKAGGDRYGQDRAECGNSYMHRNRQAGYLA